MQPLSIIISIGRNVGSEPMSDEAWEAFKAEVLNRATHPLLWESKGPDYTGCTYGVGIWEGVEEQTMVCNVVGTSWFDTLNATGALSRTLGKLATKYNQDAIALTVGRPTMVGAA